jgi:hypothetical protein
MNVRSFCLKKNAMQNQYKIISFMDLRGGFLDRKNYIGRIFISYPGKAFRNSKHSNIRNISTYRIFWMCKGSILMGSVLLKTSLKTLPRHIQVPLNIK